MPDSPEAGQAAIAPRPMTTASQSSKDANESSSRIFALAFAVMTLVCVAIGSLYVYFYIINGESIIWMVQQIRSNSPSVAPGLPTSSYDSDFMLYVIVGFERFFPLVLIALFALSFVRASVSFVRAGEYGRTGVVPPRDLPIIEQAIREGKPEPVDQYIRLASLTGGVGIFQKIGLTGLPLTTLALVIFFAIGTMIFNPETETFNAYLDFTKLTLGAFIGSFVQRQVERRGQENDIQRAIQTVANQSPGSSAPSPTQQGSPQG